ncbi:hypothetical protein [Enemella sp. A6]|uniref:hypothetical protein n=1 Tax=Enemella sp. A6 TaxID=3440152 RepID=UPI003EBBF8C7
MVAELVARHFVLAVLPIVAGTGVAVLLRLLRRDVPGSAGRVLDTLIGFAGALPVVAVWVLLPIVTGQPLMRTVHLEIALSLLVLGLVYPALAGVSRNLAAERTVRALGMPLWLRAWWSLRRWLPALSRGLAPAWVATVLGVTLAALLHKNASNGLGRMLLEGWRADDQLSVIAATLLVMVLAAAGDFGFRLLGRAAGVTPVEVR